MIDQGLSGPIDRNVNRVPRALYEVFGTAVGVVRGTGERTPCARRLHGIDGVVERLADGGACCRVGRRT